MIRRIEIFFKIVLFIFGLYAAIYAFKWETYTTSNSGLLCDTVNVIAITPDSLILFGTPKGLSVFNGLRWTTYSDKELCADVNIRDIKIDLNIQPYAIWLTSESGITLSNYISIDALSVLSVYDKDNSGLICDTVAAMTLDDKFVKWFGTKKGVSVLSEDKWINITTENYLLSNMVNDLACDQSGLVHIATKGGGVSRLRIDEVDGITAASTIVSTWSWLLSDTIYTVFIDNNDIQWYGTGEGLFRHSGIDSKINWAVYQIAEGLVDNFVQTITQDSCGFLWIGTKKGVSLFNDGTFSNFTSQDGLVNDIVNDIAVDKNGGIWFATNGGVSKLIRSDTRVKESSKKLTSFFVKNYPNPFNGGTVINFKIPKSTEIGINIFNIFGKKVKSFKKQFYSAGENSVYWEAENNEGQPLSSGVYVAVIKNHDIIKYHKMMLLK